MIRLAKLLSQKILSNKYGKKSVVDSIKLPNGKVYDWTYFICQPGAIIVSLTSDKKIILVKQYRYTLKSFTYENPAGSCHQNQSPESTATQELLEETGYVAPKLISLGSYYDLPNETNHQSQTFLALDCQLKETPKLDNEAEIYEELSIEIHPFLEIYNSLGQQNSLIKSSEHVAAIFLAHRYLTSKNLL
jgi:ADP-ribose pyrophosphatase